MDKIDNRTESTISKEWAKITVERLVKNLEKQKIGYSATLKRSLKWSIIEATEGNIDKIRIVHWYWGMFVDMGVGRGQALGDVRDNRSVQRLLGDKKGRRPKKWYSKTMFAEVNTLADIMIGYYANKSIITTMNLPRIVEM